MPKNQARWSHGDSASRGLFNALEDNGLEVLQFTSVQASLVPNTSSSLFRKATFPEGVAEELRESSVRTLGDKAMNHTEVFAELIKKPCPLATSCLRVE